MVSLLVRYTQPLHDEPAHTAQQIVMWFAAQGWTLWVLLIGLPFAVLVIASFTLLKNWFRYTQPRQAALRSFTPMDVHGTTLIIAAEALAAGIILAIVAVHMLLN